MTKLLRMAALLLIMVIGSAVQAFAADGFTDIDDLPAKLPVGQFVVDPQHILSQQCASQVNERLYALRTETTASMVVVVLQSIGDYEISDYAVQLFDRWKVGYADKDNGLIFILAINQRKAFLSTGYGLEGVLTDADCSSLCRTYVNPAMKENNPDAAVTAIVGAVSKILTDPSAKEEILSPSQEKEMRGIDDSIDEYEVWQIVYAICGIVFLVAMVLFVISLRKVRGKDKYFRALHWRSELPVFWILALFSFGAGLVFAVPAWLLYRRARNRRKICETCGAKMRKLSESEDNELLSASQDLEEKLGTVDYDVWECPRCGTIERLPFLQKQTAYTRCPKCNTVALKLVANRIVRRPTTRTPGLGVKIYECRYCGHREEKPYNIPPDEGGNGGALVAGALLGSALGGNGGGGGFGGFSAGGGGMTGGGGGGSSW